MKVVPSLLFALVVASACSGADNVEAPDAAMDMADAAPIGPLTEDNCLGDQDDDAPDVDVSQCPAVPTATKTAKMEGKNIDLGAWEIGTTAQGATYKIRLAVRARD